MKNSVFKWDWVALPSTSKTEKNHSRIFSLRNQCINAIIACQYYASKYKALLKRSVYRIMLNSFFN